LFYQDTKIALQIDSLDAYVNGQKQKLLFPPQLKSERSMVPLRFIAESFGADVGYDPATQLITVIKERVKSLDIAVA